VTTEDLSIEGWKGKDEIEIETERDGYLLKFHRKNKQSGEVKTESKFVSKFNAQRVWKMINDNCPLRETKSYRFLIKKFIEEVGVDINSVVPEFEAIDEEMKYLRQGTKDKFYAFVDAIKMELFNGGKFRNDESYWLFYNCLKIFEKKDYIVYLGRGGIIKVKQGELI